MYIKKRAALFLILCLIIGLILGGMYYFYSTRLRPLELTFQSDIPSIALEKADTSLFFKYFTVWKFYDRPFIILGDTIHMNEVKQIKIVLTPQPQKEDIFRFDTPDSEILQATGQAYNRKEKTITIFVYLSPELILKQKPTSEISSRIIYSSLLRLYTIAYPGNIDTTIFTQQVKNVRHTTQFDTIVHVKKQ